MYVCARKVPPMMSTCKIRERTENIFSTRIPLPQDF